MKHFFIAFAILISLSSFGQEREIEDVYELPIPKSLEKCFPTLDRTLSDAELEVVKNYPEDSIYDHDEFRDATDFFHAWKLYDGSKLTKYFNKLGLTGSHEIYETILISYHRHLNNEPLKLDEQIAKYQAKQKADYEAYIERTKKDTLNGLYIPKNIDECIVEFDKVYEEKSKQTFKDQDEQKAVSMAYGFGPGLWIRNNWGLWGGSRLQKYFIDLNVSDPEAMSWIILTSYHRSINGKSVDFEEQIKKRK
jgi:hypothetical protein